MTSKQITLPITGMTCVNCAATIEGGLKKLPTAQNAVANLASERAMLEFDPVQLSQADIIARIQKSGYGVTTGEAVLPILAAGAMALSSIFVVANCLGLRGYRF